MKSFAAYISKYLISFSAFIVALLIANVIFFIWTFDSTIRNDYGYTSPQNMLEVVSESSTKDGTTEETEALLHAHQIWAIYLNPDGQIAWSYDTPEELPVHYTIQDVALFSKGYLADYPVFVWNDEDGLLILGYPKDSYTKFTTNYFSAKAVQKIPVFFIVMALFDFALMFCAYFLSKRKILKSTEPIIASIHTLSEGKPAALSTNDELSEVADSINKASHILSRQNEARANWISGVSHDIRTPLSMIIGYTELIGNDQNTSPASRERAQIIQRQGQKIKTLVEDLNLVSRLEYDMQPMDKKSVRLSKLLRSYMADLLNSGLPESYTIDFEITPNAENLVLDCDTRLLSRAINNLVQNSIHHNSEGCHIQITLDCDMNTAFFCISDDGIGLSSDQLNDLNEKTHYMDMDSTDDRLNLRHGLGLVLVRQIAEVHGGTVMIDSQTGKGFKTILGFPR
ncbi:MAG: HAMP domain-containing sensor histidine kinase [Lachnospiraceae bacterium]|nr:HAMP domain-containing sensor histidine kinase [Lachnospiraceae bacterium]